MHISSGMIDGAVCPVTMAVAGLGVAAAAVALFRNRDKAPSAGMFAVVTAAVFGVQMVNYSVAPGVSGHLLAGVLAASLIGVPAAVLSMALVLAVQAFMFGDGGISVLGANALNMAVVGAGIGGMLHGWISARLRSRHISAGLAAVASVELAAFAICVELAAAGVGSWALYRDVLLVHAGLAAIEGLATGAIVFAADYSKERRGSYAVPVALVAGCLALVPFASAFPDGFEWAMSRSGLLAGLDGLAGAPFADYIVPGISNAAMATLSAGAVGVAVVAAAAYALLLPFGAYRRNRA